MNIDNFQFIDLGLPSGRLWATENVKDKNGNEAYYTFDNAVNINIFGKNLPSSEDWKELFKNSTWSWNEERKGYDVTGPNGNSIFLPAAGYRVGIGVYGVGVSCYYWSSSVNDENLAYVAGFSGDRLHPQLDDYRGNGFCVRLVQ